MSQDEEVVKYKKDWTRNTKNFERFMKMMLKIKVAQTSYHGMTSKLLAPLGDN